MSGSAGNQAGRADAFVDITTVVCPVTFVKTQAALEELEDGRTLEIRLSAGEPIQNVPRSLKDEGHKVTAVTLCEDGAYLIRVVKGGLR
jgi:TusA-related sulfurtransferase